MMSGKTLVTVPSGKIELVLIDQGPVIQFNCSCDDALPYCNAVCCRHRPTYNLALDGEEEIKRFADSSIEHPDIPGIRLLDYTAEGDCVHLLGNRCLVHACKPSICRHWHCSPGGIGEDITIHDDGFSLLPARGDLQHEFLDARNQ
jgi:hypothetical protein